MSKYLTKKGHSGGVGNDRAIHASQVSQGPMPTGGVSNTTGQNHANTKSTGGSKPEGKGHSKVIGAAPTQVGKYL